MFLQMLRATGIALLAVSCFSLFLIFWKHSKAHVYEEMTQQLRQSLFGQKKREEVRLAAVFSSRREKFADNRFKMSE